MSHSLTPLKIFFDAYFPSKFFAIKEGLSRGLVSYGVELFLVSKV